MDRASEGGRPPDEVDLTDPNGIRKAYDTHGNELYRFAFRQLGDSGSAQDAVQETFLRVWQSADRYDSARASLRVWLYAILRNVVIDAIRRRNKASWPQVPGDEGTVSRALPPVDDASDSVLERTVIGGALDKLSVEHREVIVETYLRGRSYDELAAEHGVPVGTLRSRTFYALKALRNTMQEMGVTL